MAIAVADQDPIETQKRRDLAQQYQLMVGLAAWKHFRENILDRISGLATREEDSWQIDELTPARIAECRGRRKAIDKILSDVQYILDGLR